MKNFEWLVLNLSSERCSCVFPNVTTRLHFNLSESHNHAGVSLLSVLLICYWKSFGISAMLQKLSRTDDNHKKSFNSQWVCFWFYFEIHDSWFFWVVLLRSSHASTSVFGIDNFLWCNFFMFPYSVHFSHFSAFWILALQWYERVMRCFYYFEVSGFI